MLAVVGTVPRDDFPMVQGRAVLNGTSLTVDGHVVEINRAPRPCWRRRS